MSCNRVISLARGELGTCEEPSGSNRVKYWDAYDPKMQGQPWCVAFLWAIFQQAGERMAFFGGGKTASCSTLLMWYQNMEQTVPVEDVQVGDIVLLNFHGKSDPEHCGLVVDVGWTSPESDGWIWTIEGNTTPGLEGSQDNGGSVALKTRLRSQIVAVCRPQYQPEEPKPVDDWSNHHAADAIRWGIDMGLIKGYPDGSMRPDEPVPLWRLLTILKRYHERMEEAK